MILVYYKIRVPAEDKVALYDIKEKYTLVKTDNWDVAKMEIKKRFPTAHDMYNNTITL